jgi:hypothetical protein
VGEVYWAREGVRVFLRTSHSHSPHPWLLTNRRGSRDMEYILSVDSCILQNTADTRHIHAYQLGQTSSLRLDCTQAKDGHRRLHPCGCHMLHPRLCPCECVGEMGCMCVCVVDFFFVELPIDHSPSPMLVTDGGRQARDEMECSHRTLVM